MKWTIVDFFSLFHNWMLVKFICLCKTMWDVFKRYHYREQIWNWGLALNKHKLYWLKFGIVIDELICCNLSESNIPKFLMYIQNGNCFYRLMKLLCYLFSGTTTTSPVLLSTLKIFFQTSLFLLRSLLNVCSPQ